MLFLNKVITPFSIATLNEFRRFANEKIVLTSLSLNWPPEQCLLPCFRCRITDRLPPRLTVTESGFVFIIASFLKTHFRDICQVAGKHYACFSNQIYACNALTKHPHLCLYTCVECVSGLLIWNKTSVNLLQ